MSNKVSNLKQPSASSDKNFQERLLQYAQFICATGRFPDSRANGIGPSLHSWISRILAAQRNGTLWPEWLDRLIATRLWSAGVQTPQQLYSYLHVTLMAIQHTGETQRIGCQTCLADDEFLALIGQGVFTLNDLQSMEWQLPTTDCMNRARLKLLAQNNPNTYNLMGWSFVADILGCSTESLQLNSGAPEELASVVSKVAKLPVKDNVTIPEQIAAETKSTWATPAILLAISKLHPRVYWAPWLYYVREFPDIWTRLSLNTMRPWTIIDKYMAIFVLYSTAYSSGTAVPVESDISGEASKVSQGFNQVYKELWEAFEQALLHSLTRGVNTLQIFEQDSEAHLQLLKDGYIAYSAYAQARANQPEDETLDLDSKKRNNIAMQFYLLLQRKMDETWRAADAETWSSTSQAQGEDSKLCHTESEPHKL